MEIIDGTATVRYNGNNHPSGRGATNTGWRERPAKGGLARAPRWVQAKASAQRANKRVKEAEYVRRYLNG